MKVWDIDLSKSLEFQEKINWFEVIMNLPELVFLFYYFVGLSKKYLVRGEDLIVIFYQICLISLIDINQLKEKFHKKPRNTCWCTHSNVAAVYIF